jgi:two-component system response regulator YesN
MLGDRLDQYIQDNYHDADLTLQKAADSMGLHPKYAGTIFKRAKKITFSQRLISYRIVKASNLLKNDDLSITDIAFRVGFNSASHFSKVFKDLKKVTPAEFRKEN